MGEIASRLADEVIVTSGNPRSEDPAKIIEEIAAGVRAEHRRGRRPQTEPSRTAIANAEAGDVVVIAGKGHEQGQEFEGGRKIPFDDVTVAREALRGAAIGASERPRRDASVSFLTRGLVGPCFHALV